MKIEYEGQVYEYEPDDLSVKQAAKIERHIFRGNLEAVTAGVQIQLAALAQRSPQADLGPLAEAVGALVSLAERAGGPGTLMEWERGLLNCRSDCIQALAWLLMHDGRQVPIADVDVKVVRLHRALVAALQPAAEDGETPGPTQAAAGPAANGKTRSRSSSPTA